jgi:hypothetical protein
MITEPLIRSNQITLKLPSVTRCIVFAKAHFIVSDKYLSNDLITLNWSSDFCTLYLKYIVHSLLSIILCGRDL